jgi:enamine deaminase RidA (YjgF/YER057c/UK114 family)
MTSTISFSNPAGVHAPVGAYTHGLVVPSGARTLYVAGQVGLRPDGSIGKDVLEQADQAFRNMGIILSANGFAFCDVVKLTTYIVQGQPGAEALGVRRTYFGAHRPATTAVYVSQLFLPEWLVEIEAIAARTQCDQDRSRRET